MVEQKPNVKKLRTFFNVFYVDEIKKYSLTQADAITLYWFLNFASSGGMKQLDDSEIPYFWVDYNYANECLLTNSHPLRDSFDRLCGIYRKKLMNPDLEYPLISTIRHTVQGKRKYFGFNGNTMKQIDETNISMG